MVRLVKEKTQGSGTVSFLPFFLAVIPLLLMNLASSVAWGMDDNVVGLRAKKGDNLIHICRRFLNNPQDWPLIARLNKLDNPHLIFPDQEIRIPVHLLRGVPLDGKATFTKGEVTIKGAETDTWKPLAAGDRISHGDFIKTGGDGTLEIGYEDDVALLLRPNTALRVVAAIRTGPLQYLYQMLLDLGRTITDIKRNGGAEPRFEIRTPSAVAAARGTGYRVGVDDGGATRCEVLEGSVDVHGKGKGVIVSAGEGTIVSRDAAPAAPKHLLPPPRTVVEPLYRSMPLDFTFSPVEGAAGFRVMLTRDQERKDVARERLIAPHESFRILDADDGTYYLFVRSVDREGLEGLDGDGEVVRVRVNPLPPFISSPADGALHRGRSIQTTWLRVQDVKGYHLQIAGDPDFVSIVEEHPSLSSESLRTGDLDYGTYYLRVSSIAGDGYEGIWSDAIHFTTEPLPPAPALEPPSEKDGFIRLRWRDLGPGISYHFQMAADPEFNTILADERLDRAETTFAKPDKPGTYYARTSSIDPEGFEGDFSDPQSFEIKSNLEGIAIGIFWTTVLLIIIL